MAWFRDRERTWLEKLSINVLKNGPIPKHVAFIMDGNRRYATKLGLRNVEGHALGFEKLSESLEWCLNLGVMEVTIYALSIENFKRSKEEIEGIMNLAIDKFQQLLQEKEKLDKYGVHIRFLGDLQLLPVELQKLVAEVILYTKKNTKVFLNVCLAYTARDEMTNAVRDIADGVLHNMLDVDDVTEELVERSLYSETSSQLDLLVRTSGEVRLSDFLLWQSSFSLLSFVKVLWPEFSIWHLFLAVLYYQHNYVNLEQNLEYYKKEKEDKTNVQENSSIVTEKEKLKNKQNRFIDDLYVKRQKKLEDMKAGLTNQKMPCVAQ